MALYAGLFAASPILGALALAGGPFRGFTLTGQVSRGFRDPTLSDRYFAGTTARGVIVGNPDLDPESSRQLDLAIRGGGGRVRVGGFAYLYRIRDLIERYEADPDTFAFRNRGEQELIVRYALSKRRPN